MGVGETGVIDREGLGSLLAALREQGFLTLGPRVQDGAIVYSEIASVAELPKGWHDEQAPGRYRLHRNGADTLFGFVLGPRSWKAWLHPPALRLWRARRSETGFELVEGAEEPQRIALIGARACELQAIAVQDRVFLGPSEHVDPHYQAGRERIFVVAVNCTVPGGTCFCASLGTGPRARTGFDLALTELRPERLLVEVGSEPGARLLASIAHGAATPEDTTDADAALRDAASRMGRSLETDGLKELLYASAQSGHWDAVGQRCLGCTNCTLVCPTCFCTTIEDVCDLGGATAERVRRWDSCFTLDFSYIHGGSVRMSAGARYRHWMTHKLATWQDQFGTLGCVGCGRCITWCPVGIDITQEAGALRALAAEAGRGEGGAQSPQGAPR